MPAPSRSVVLQLKAIQAWDRYRLGRVQRRHPGLSIDPSASTNLACAQFDLAAGARAHARKVPANGLPLLSVLEGAE